MALSYFRNYNRPYRRFRRWYGRTRFYRSYSGLRYAGRRAFRRGYSSFRGKYASYTKGRKTGVVWGIIFALVLIPLVIYLYNNWGNIKKQFNTANK